MPTRLVAIAVFIFQGLMATARAADPVAWLPADINAVARINVLDVYKSQLAQKEGWLKKSTESFIQQEAFIPPGTSQIVIGAQLDLSSDMNALQKYSILVPDQKTKLESLIAWVPGEIETYSGKPLGNFTNSGFVADAGDGCWLTNGSFSRQLITRWLKAGPKAGGRFQSEYLKAALNSKEPAQLLMAIDLGDNFSAQFVGDELKATDWFKSPSEAESVAKILESVQGITIAFTVDTKSTGKATIDFAKDVTSLKSVLDRLVDAVTQRAGVSPDDIQGWTWSTKGHQIVGIGPVLPGGGRRLVSFLDPPAITLAMAQSANESADPAAANKPKTGAPLDPAQIGKITMKYFKSFQVLIEDLRHDLKNTKYNYAVYFEKYAKKIDDLPTLHVDPVMLDFAARVSSSIRYQSQTYRMNNIGAGVSKAGNLASGVGSYGSYYGGATAAGVATAGISIDAQKNQASRGLAISEWKQIDEGMAALRRALTDKYQVQF